MIFDLKENEDILIIPKKKDPWRKCSTSQGNMKETIAENMGDYISSLDNVVHNFHNLKETFKYFE